MCKQVGLDLVQSAGPLRIRVDAEAVVVFHAVLVARDVGEESVAPLILAECVGVQKAFELACWTCVGSHLHQELVNLPCLYLIHAGALAADLTLNVARQVDETAVRFDAAKSDGASEVSVWDELLVHVVVVGDAVVGQVVDLLHPLLSDGMRHHLRHQLSWRCRCVLYGHVFFLLYLGSCGPSFIAPQLETAPPLHPSKRPKRMPRSVSGSAQELLELWVLLKGYWNVEFQATSLCLCCSHEASLMEIAQLLNCRNVFRS